MKILKLDTIIRIRISMNVHAKLEEIVYGPIWKNNKSQFVREAIIEKIKRLEENFNGDEIE